jgi:hypothetical protein
MYRKLRIGLIVVGRFVSGSDSLAGLGFNLRRHYVVDFRSQLPGPRFDAELRLGEVAALTPSGGRSATSQARIVYTTMSSRKPDLGKGVREERWSRSTPGPPPGTGICPPSCAQNVDGGVVAFTQGLLIP